MDEEAQRSPRSLPVRTADAISRRIASGEWAPGARLPAEPALAESLGVSRATVRSALRRLAEAGAVRIRHGTGTFVSEHGGAIRASLQSLRSTSQLIRDQGHEFEIRYRHRTLRAATEAEAGRLRRSSLPVVLDYERAFLGRRSALAFESGVIAADGLPVGTDAEALTGSIFEFLEPLGMLPDQSLTHVRATHDPDLAWGERRPATPLYLTLEQTQFLPSGTAVSWSATHFVQDQFDFTLIRAA